MREPIENRMVVDSEWDVLEGRYRRVGRKEEYMEEIADERYNSEPFEED